MAINFVVQPGIKPQNVAHDGKMVADDKTPTLIQNDLNQYTMAPRYLALERVKLNKAVILTPADGDEYIKGMKLALGIQEGVDAKSFVQRNGHYVHADNLGKIDVAGILAAAEEDVKKYEVDKKSGLIASAEMPPGAESFEGKKRKKFSAQVEL